MPDPFDESTRVSEPSDDDPRNLIKFGHLDGRNSRELQPRSTADHSFGAETKARLVGWRLAAQRQRTLWLLVARIGDGQIWLGQQLAIRSGDPQFTAVSGKT